VTSSRIGLIGGLSWVSTASYYRYFHELSIGGDNEWSEPNVLIDSIDFGLIVPLQREGDWTATGVLLADSARRLERAGATVLGIGANTMHINFEQVEKAVQIPVVDVRVAVANEALAGSHKTMALLGTKYLLERTFYSDRLAELGLSTLKPTASQIDRLQEIIFQELTKGVVTNTSRDYLRDVALSLLDRGADVVGLCCTEFGMLMSEDETFAVIDSTKAHVRALVA
jgi:aspartate racemase